MSDLRSARQLVLLAFLSVFGSCSGCPGMHATPAVVKIYNNETLPIQHRVAVSPTSMALCAGPAGTFSSSTVSGIGTVTFTPTPGFSGLATIVATLHETSASNAPCTSVVQVPIFIEPRNVAAGAYLSSCSSSQVPLNFSSTTAPSDSRLLIQSVATTCPVGFELQGGLCNRISAYCNPRPASSNGGVGSCGSSTHLGGSCSPSCNTGYMSMSPATCTQGGTTAGSGTWSGGDCSLNPSFCPPPSILAPTWGTAGSCGTSHSLGSQCSVTCTNGTLVGATRTCTTSGWDGTSQFCRGCIDGSITWSLDSSPYTSTSVGGLVTPTLNIAGASATSSRNSLFSASAVSLASCSSTCSSYRMTLDSVGFRTWTFTWAMWIKVTNYVASGILIDFRDGQIGYVFVLQQSGVLTFQDGQGVTTSTPGSVPLNSWTHVMLSHHITTGVKIYINRALAAAGDKDMSAYGVSTRVIYIHGSPDTYWNGAPMAFDDITFATRAVDGGAELVCSPY